MTKQRIQIMGIEITPILDMLTMAAYGPEGIDGDALDEMDPRESSVAWG
jgi:hypothetical protein